MRLDQYTKSKLEESASAFFLRLQHTNPFPVSKEGVVPHNRDVVYNTYISCLPASIRNAVLLLMATSEYSSFLDTNSQSSLIVTTEHESDPNKYVHTQIIFSFNNTYPSCTRWDQRARLDREHISYDEIVQWMYRAEKTNIECRRCQNYVSHIIQHANTAGQLRTMFPEYVHLLPEHQQKHIANMKKRSTLPKNIDQEYLNKHRQFVAEKVALCLLLPEGREKIWLR